MENDNQEIEKDVNKEDKKTNLNDEYVNINENKTGLDRQFSEAKFLGKQWLNIFKTQTVSTVIGGIVFIVALILVPKYLTDIFYDIRKDMGLLGFVIGVASVILISILFTVTYRSIAIHLVKKDKHAIKTTGKVVASSLLSSNIISSGNDFHGSRKVLGTTYKVKIKVQKKTTIAYSKNYYYAPNEEVTILFNPKRPWYCLILPTEQVNV